MLVTQSFVYSIIPQHGTRIDTRLGVAAAATSVVLAMSFHLWQKGITRRLGFFRFVLLGVLADQVDEQQVLLLVSQADVLHNFRSPDMIPSCGERLLRGYGETEAEVTARVVDDFCVQFLTYFRHGFRAMW